MNQNDAIEVFHELAPNCNDIQEHFGTYRKRPKMDEIRVFPTNQVNMELFSIDGNFIKIKVDDQESNVTMVSFSGTNSNPIVFILSFSIYYLLTQITNAFYVDLM